MPLKGSRNKECTVEDLPWTRGSAQRLSTRHLSPGTWVLSSDRHTQDLPSEGNKQHVCVHSFEMQAGDLSLSLSLSLSLFLYFFLSFFFSFSLSLFFLLSEVWRGLSQPTHSIQPWLGFSINPRHTCNPAGRQKEQPILPPPLFACPFWPFNLPTCGTIPCS